MKTYSTAEGDFILPDQWKELLGKDVLELRQTIASRLKDLGIYLNVFKKTMQDNEEYLSWYSKRAQLNLAAKLKQRRTFTVEGRTFTLPEDWKPLLGEEVLQYKVTMRQRLHSLGISAHSFRYIMKDCEDFKEWYKPRKQIGLVSIENARQSIFTRKQTCIQKYGVDNVFYSEDIKERIRQTSEQKYGVPYHKMLTKDQMKERLKVFNLESDTLPENCSEEFEATCMTCGKKAIYHFNRGIPVACPYCNNRSTVLERHLVLFLEERGIETLPHFRPAFLNGKELDIYIPSKAIAFEINGAHSHNSGFSPYGKRPKSRSYHKEKTDLAAKHGIKLYHLWEHWDTEIIESVILSKLNNQFNKLNARQLSLEVQPYSDKIKVFLEENHLLGDYRASINITLSNENGIQLLLQAVNTKEAVYITRNASKLNTIVRGGFMRTLKKLKELTNKDIITYAQRDLTPDPYDSVYFKAGFTFEGDAGPSMLYWVRRNIVLSSKTLRRGVYPRNRFMKEKLTEFEGVETVEGDKFHFSKDKTEKEMLEELGIYQVFNSGCFKYTLYAN